MGLKGHVLFRSAFRPFDGVFRNPPSQVTPCPCMKISVFLGVFFFFGPVRVIICTHGPHLYVLHRVAAVPCGVEAWPDLVSTKIF